MPTVDCSQGHWGEILGYVPLGAVPSPYPGDDQASALVQFRCGLLLAQQGRPAAQFTTSTAWAGQAYWNDGGKAYENYATCVVNRTDDQPLPGGHLVNPQRRYDDVSVAMNWYSTNIGGDPPVGSCFATDIRSPSPNDTRPVVECYRPHWGEIVGYPVLYNSDTSWPGDDAVKAAAVAACQKLADGRSLVAPFTYNATYPGQANWSKPHQQLHAICTAIRADNQIFSGGLR